jgi:Cof subfamily protein (haloacid dehalogenase superfamily)
MVIPQHLIALDLDGTLLNRSKKISQPTLQYLKKIQADHLIVLATGRPFRSFIHYYQQLGLSTPMVCYNGAFITNPTDATFIPQSFAFPQQVVKDIEAELGGSNIENIMCETNERIWLLKQETKLASFFWHDHMTIIYGPLKKTLTENPMTMIIKVKKRGPALDQLIIQAVKQHPGLLVRFWGESEFCELYYRQISKGSALLKLLTYYRVSKKYFLSFGDAENDKEMLTLAEHGFVMKNAHPSMHDIGDVVTRKDHNHDGIIDELQRYFKQFKLNK